MRILAYTILFYMKEKSARNLALICFIPAQVQFQEILRPKL